MTKEKIKTGGGLIMILLGVLDAGNLIKLGTFHGLLFFIAVILMAEMGISFLYQKKAQKELKFLKKLLLILAVIEATIFQFNSYHLLIGNYPELTLNLNAAKITNFDKNSHENISSGVTSFEFTGIESLLQELIYHEDIIEWGKSNNIWYSFSLLCQISDKMGYNQFAFDLLCILARSAPEKYWQQEAVLKLDEIDGVK